MNAIGHLLGSAARTEVLRVLHRQPNAVGLRYIARVAGIHPHSAEVAIRALAREKLLLRGTQGGRRLYQLNRRNPDAPVLSAIFEGAAAAVTLRRSRTLEGRARSILPFIADATAMLARARGGPRVA